MLTLADNMAPTLTRQAKAVCRRVVLYFKRRYFKEAWVARWAWILYASIGTLVMLVAAHPEDAATVLLIYAFPSYLLMLPFGPFIGVFGENRVLDVVFWFLMCGVNGWFVYRVFCRFRVKPELPNHR